jgi:RNA polymerase sigma-70 factor, ECF subfamily
MVKRVALHLLNCSSLRESADRVGIMDEDREIVARIVDGDYDAFETLVEKYQGRIYRHLRKMVHDNSQVEDLLQETFLSAYRGLHGFAGSSSFATWLFRIATNTALMFLRKNHPEVVEFSDEIGNRSDIHFVPASPEFISTPLDMLLSQEGKRKLEKAIDSLPFMYRTVLVLRDVEGFSLEEVSRIMESSIPAVKSRLHRARHSVREALNVYYAERNGSSKRSASRHHD